MRALVGNALHLEVPAERLRPLGHRPEPEPRPAVSPGQPRVKATAVVVHREVELTCAHRHMHADRLCPRMPPHVRERLLDDAEDVDLGFG